MGQDTIERTLPLKVHKNMVVAFLRQYPGDLQKISPGYDGTAEQFIAELEAHPAQWIVDGILREDSHR